MIDMILPYVKIKQVTLDNTLSKSVNWYSSAGRTTDDWRLPEKYMWSC